MIEPMMKQVHDLDEQFQPELYSANSSSVLSSVDFHLVSNL